MNDPNLIDTGQVVREKSNWRNELKARLVSARRDFVEGREKAEQQISSLLQQWLSMRPGMWLSFRGFSTEPRLALQSTADVTFAFPKIQNADRLEFYRWTGGATLEAPDWTVNQFGIEEPSTHSSWVKVEPSDQVQGALIPALGFDRRLSRLGRGRGYYDRFLRSFNERRLQMGGSPILKIGIGFSEQLVDELPRDSHDVKLDAVLTDREVIVSYNLKGD